MGVFVHLWYIAADFQLFLVALLVIQLRLRTRVSIVAFASLSLACCSFSAWQMHDSRYTPVVMGVYTSITDYTKMLTGVYMLPTFHGACYFMGCIMALVLREFKPSNISRLSQAILWVVGMSCCLTTIFVRYDFNRGEHSTKEWVKITLAFWDRIIWATFLAALTFLCANGSGGAVQKFLAWGAFVPLSRLCFGIYLVHIPWYFVSSNVRKELMYWSVYNVVTVAFTAYIWSLLIACIIFFVCEAPTGRISKLLLVPKRLFSEHEESTVAKYSEECYNISKLASKPVDKNESIQAQLTRLPQVQ
ncbi:conserved hypothetical protein [Ixodes scapularis]|uniref:Acyltransferase 3 domain-containing protein n=1 Tax=Ixodes scapularis TaxID=6945 RepID=B7QLV3_IXOSC|nr:conserved hypothetical protein [Ixodes scapularis]|eukprot:XP_002416158.1 conserved hypothetical protein [Ixodes scapularis]